ncbi:hypothetical protein VB834_21340 [Limnoraphis robusta Tam1]|uniref:hypothetical protein n=1 Tax=Limnoraphis robusta TaxID=1118279 RepID=UPI002B207BF6|nr:hypothetical protein [Limnoraphis robusta]MEA5541576.1 hypothetical protein [Limnoraphis robusta Tam1]
MMFNLKNLLKILAITGMVGFASIIDPREVLSQVLIEKDHLLIAQNLAGIEREIPLEEVPISVMTSAETVSGAQFNLARTELRADGSLIYKIRGENQQGFEVEVQVTSTGNIIQLDEQIDSSAVPEPVIKALEKWIEDAPVISTWRSTRLGEFVYQFVIEDFWLEVTEDASKVTIYRRLR